MKRSTFLNMSFDLQVAVGIGLILMSRYNIKEYYDICSADRINNFCVIGVFLITIINVFIASFSVSATTWYRKLLINFNVFTKRYIVLFLYIWIDKIVYEKKKIYFNFSNIFFIKLNDLDLQNNSKFSWCYYVCHLKMKSY